MARNQTQQTQQTQITADPGAAPSGASDSLPLPNSANSASGPNDRHDPAGSSGPHGPPVRCIVIGGFLGAGKTTAIGKLGSFLRQRSLKVGWIAHDQGIGLESLGAIDTAALRSQGFSPEEILGSNLLTGAHGRLTASPRPQVLIAEPAAGGANLAAVVTQPLRRLYGQNFSIAPLSVLVDPIRAAQVFGLEPGGGFSDPVVYLYKKQLEEAGIIVINKCDLLPASKLTALQRALQAIHPQAALFTLSARHGQGLEAWFNHLLAHEQLPRDEIHLDGGRYAEGQALLGWLNCTAGISSVKYFDTGKLLLELASGIQGLLRQENAEVAHLKMTFQPNDGLDGLAVINLVRNDSVPEFAHQLPEPINGGVLTLNLRAEADPEILHNIVNQALMDLIERSRDLFVRMEHSEHFRPGQPQTTFRDAHEAR